MELMNKWKIEIFENKAEQFLLNKVDEMKKQVTELHKEVYDVSTENYILKEKVAALEVAITSLACR